MGQMTRERYVAVYCLNTTATTTTLSSFLTVPAHTSGIPYPAHLPSLEEPLLVPLATVTFGVGLPATGTVYPSQSHKYLYTGT